MDGAGERRLLSGSVIEGLLAEVHAGLASVNDGAVADYIPALSKALPEWFGIAIATVDGQIYGVGDTDRPSSIQSVSKPFMYGNALKLLGPERVLTHVGVEPTGEAFNSVVLDKVNNRPFNPMVNSGAIAVTGLMPGATRDERRGNMLDLLGRFAGRTLEVDEEVYQSECDTGHWNRAITYMMLNSGMIAGDALGTLDLYFRQCSVRVTARDLAVMAATLANDGVNPLTGDRLLGPAEVRDVLTVMMTCGMYNYAGQWAFEAGMPAKSGVSGCVIAVIPGQIGIGVFSPPLDGHGNSVRGVRACLDISRRFGLHVLSNRPSVGAVVRREVRGDTVASKRRRTIQEAHVLEAGGRQIVLLELQGALFFGSAERLIRRVAALCPEVRFVIVDFRRVYQVDATAVGLVARLCEAGRGTERTLLLTGLGAAGPLTALRDAVADLGASGTLRLEDDADAALEWCEELLLADHRDGRDRAKLALSRLDIFAGLSRDDVRLLETVVQPMSFAKGEVILREGDPARAFFVVARGSVRVVLPVEGGRMHRIADIGPGLTFGEMALIDGGRRSAGVIAEDDVLCYCLAVEALHEISAERPAIMTTILSNLARDLSERLRRANREIRALS